MSTALSCFCPGGCIGFLANAFWALTLSRCHTPGLFFRAAFLGAGKLFGSCLGSDSAFAGLAISASSGMQDQPTQWVNRQCVTQCCLSLYATSTSTTKVTLRLFSPERSKQIQPPTFLHGEKCAVSLHICWRVSQIYETQVKLGTWPLTSCNTTHQSFPWCKGFYYMWWTIVI